MVSEPKENNVAFPYERQAMNGDELPNGLEYPDQVLYLSFRMLYAQLRQGVIDRDTAVREKRKLLKDIDYVEVYEFSKLLKEAAFSVKASFEYCLVCDDTMILFINDNRSEDER